MKVWIVTVFDKAESEIVAVLSYEPTSEKLEEFKQRSQSITEEHCCGKIRCEANEYEVEDES